MKTLILAATTSMLAFTFAAPVLAAVSLTDGFTVDAGQSSIDKRKKPRIKGGSGCDDARDVIEHPECR